MGGGVLPRGAQAGFVTFSINVWGLGHMVPPSSHPDTLRPEGKLSSRPLSAQRELSLYLSILLSVSHLREMCSCTNRQALRAVPRRITDTKPHQKQTENKTAQANGAMATTATPELPSEIQGQR